MSSEDNLHVTCDLCTPNHDATKERKKIRFLRNLFFAFILLQRPLKTSETLFSGADFVVR